MQTYTITQARANLFELANDTLANSQETLVTTKKGNLIIIGEDDWRAMQETAYLSSDSTYKKTLLDGLAASHSDCVGEDQLAW